MGIKQRVSEYCNYKNIAISKFESLAGISNGYFNNIKKRPSDDKIENIHRSFPDLNTIWLLTGEGEMLKKDISISKNPVSGSGIPFYDINVTASITENFNDIPEEPQYRIDVPFLNDCTAAFPVFGESMMPVYNPGDTVIVKEIKNRDAMLWGETYLVITNANCDNLRTIKRVFISADRRNYILRAINPEYTGDTFIATEDVIRMFLVKGKISRTQL